MKIEKKLIIGLCLVLGIGSAKSQVTIGSHIPAKEGALLDFNDGRVSAAPGEETTSKGLGMPRVELKTLKPNVNELAESIGGTSGSTPWDEASHTGLIVYNIKEATYNQATCKTEGAGPSGLYVWDGSKWQRVGTPKDEGSKDPNEAETATTLTDRDGNQYSIANFGNAGTWMTENLRTKTAPGMEAMTESASLTSQAKADMYYAYPQKAGTYVTYANRSSADQALWTKEQGLLYNWYATMNKDVCNLDEDAGQGAAEEQTAILQGICPFGWHIPSDREWNELEEEVYNNAGNYSTYTAAELSNTSIWSIISQANAWKATWNTTNTTWRGSTGTGGHGCVLKSAIAVNGVASRGKSLPTGEGFNALLVGYAYKGASTNYGILSYLWSSSSFTKTSTWHRYLRYDGDGTGVARVTHERDGLLSVRCKKD